MNKLNFKIFLENAEQNNFEKDIKESLKKLPKSHAKLIKDYKFIMEKGNTLKGDGGNVGEIDEKKKVIKIAAPYHYGREFCILHEIAHAVWKYIVNQELKESWFTIFKQAKKKNKEGLDQSAEEIFCMIYAYHYAKNKIEKFNHPELEKFIEKLPS